MLKRLSEYLSRLTPKGKARLVGMAEQTNKEENNLIVSRLGQDNYEHFFSTKDTLGLRLL